mmetsp:Transcript_159067/g.290114  ORF Transcript_159067/g.290114 Transcript_159067/m.290114 type:complete len:118 (+) Transcript_159067:2009-2362(+)
MVPSAKGGLTVNSHSPATSCSRQCTGRSALTNFRKKKKNNNVTLSAETTELCKSETALPQNMELRRPQSKIAKEELLFTLPVLPHGALGFRELQPRPKASKRLIPYCCLPMTLSHTA